MLNIFSFWSIDPKIFWSNRSIDFTQEIWNSLFLHKEFYQAPLYQQRQNVTDWFFLPLNWSWRSFIHHVWPAMEVLMLNGPSEKRPSAALMQPPCRPAAGWMPCPVTGCLGRGACQAHRSQINAFRMGPRPTGERVRKTKLRPLHFALLGAALFGADKAAPRSKQVTWVWPAITNWAVPLRGIWSHHVMRYSGRLDGGIFSNDATGCRQEQWDLRPLGSQDLHTGEKRLPLLWAAWRHSPREEWPPSWITFETPPTTTTIMVIPLFSPASTCFL